jgi:hypothetical protein
MDAPPIFSSVRLCTQPKEHLKTVRRCQLSLGPPFEMNLSLSYSKFKPCATMEIGKGLYYITSTPGILKIFEFVSLARKSRPSFREQYIPMYPHISSHNIVKIYRVTIFLNDHFVIVYTCKPHINTTISKPGYTNYVIM